MGEDKGEINESEIDEIPLGHFQDQLRGGEREREGGERERMEEDEGEINESEMLEHFQNLFNSDREITGNDYELFERLSRRNSKLVEAVDSHKQSLLHLAAANGHSKIARLLARKKPEMCLARDQKGSNPLHIAAMRGKVEVLDELFKANPLAAQAVVDNSDKESILHICVKYEQMESLSFLLHERFKDKEFVNAKDNAGNTILHLAVAHRQVKMLETVLKHPKIRVNETNLSKQTAMDILQEQMGGRIPNSEDFEAWKILFKMDVLLRCCDAKTAREAEILDPAEIAEKRNGIIVAAALMATLAFQAGVSPPGGVWQDDSDGHKSGKSVMASNYPILYSFFLCYNIIGFISSIVTLLLMTTDSPFKPGRYSKWMFITMGTTITSIAITYSISLFVVSPPPLKRDLGPKIRIASFEGIMITVGPAASVILLLLLIAIIAANIKRISRAVERINRSKVAKRRRLDDRLRIVTLFLDDSLIELEASIASNASTNLPAASTSTTSTVVTNS